MSEHLDSSRPQQEPPAVASRSAGAQLREARQARGLHLAALAASLKVTPSRLEALEQDRLAELRDAAYARALAHTVSRALGIDPAPVLRALPQASAPRLQGFDEGLDEPYREGPAARAWSPRWARLTWVAVVACAVLGWALLPRGIDFAALGLQALAPSAGGRTTSGPGTGAEASAGGTSPAASAAGASGAGSSASVFAGLQLSAVQPSWVEVLDGTGQPLLSRVLAAGEVVRMPFSPPMSLTVGNSAATEVSLNGQPIDLSASTRDNVARLDWR